MVELHRQDNKFSMKHCIPCYETDASFCLKASAFMDLAQEMAYWAAQMLGFGYDDLQKHHAAWVLSRIHFHYTAPPKWRDDVIVATWHKGAAGPFYLRDYRLESPDGKSLVECTSSWLVIDTESRRIVRDREVLGLVPGDSAQMEHAVEEPCPRVGMPAGIVPELVAEHRVEYSDVDIIGHTNNARYMVWAMDCIGYDVTSSRRVKDVYLNFNKETVPGDTVQLYRTVLHEGDTDIYYIEGMVDGKSAFCTRIEL